MSNPSVERVIKIVCDSMGTTPDKVTRETPPIRPRRRLARPGRAGDGLEDSSRSPSRTRTRRRSSRSAGSRVHQTSPGPSRDDGHHRPGMISALGNDVETNWSRILRGETASARSLVSTSRTTRSSSPPRCSGSAEALHCSTSASSTCSPCGPCSRPTRRCATRASSRARARVRQRIGSIIGRASAASPASRAALSCSSAAAARLAALRAQDHGQRRQRPGRDPPRAGAPASPPPAPAPRPGTRWAWPARSSGTKRTS